MASDKLYNLKINPGAKSSRFVVELKADSAENKTAEPMEKQAKPNVETRLEIKLDKLAEVDYGKIIKQGKEKTKNLAASLFCHSEAESRRIFNRLGINKTFSFPDSPLKIFHRASAYQRSAAQDDKKNRKSTGIKSPIARSAIWQTLDQLAFVGLAKFIYAIFKNILIGLYKICYWIGWLIMFVLRLIYFFLSAIGRPIKKMMLVLLSAYKDVVAFASTLFKGFLPLAPPVGGLGVEMTKIKAKAVKRDEFVEKNIIPPTPLYQGGVIGYLRPALAFAVVLLVIVLPLKAYTYYKSLDNIKGRVLGESASAVSDMISGGRAAADLNFGQADKSFAAAGNNFLSAQESLNEINGLIFALASIIPDKNIKLAASGKNILRAGELSAEAGKNLSLAMAGLFNYQPDGNAKLFSDLSFYGHNTIVNLTALNEVLGQIDSGLIPELYQKQFILLKQKILELSRGLGEFIALADNLDSFLGTNVDKRYLLVFQNNSELRASGGFIGSFAIIDFSKGEIKNITVPGGGSYDTEAGLLKKIKAPEPLSLVRADWHFWDANWWPDWPTSARKLAWFYENSDGSTVDGVVSFTPTVMEKLLKIIGPVDLKEKYGLVIDADNFWLETQKLAEQKLDVTNQPKKIIGDLMNKIIEELPKRLNKNNLVPLLKVMEESLADKNILFYFTDKALEDKAKEMGWGGEIKATSGDYLSVINTNIAGGKSDRKIKQEIFHSAEIQADGSIIDTLTVRRTHQGIKREIFSGVRNVNWLRIYVPLGSELLEAEGFKPVDKIFFKTVDPAWQNDQEVLAAESLARTFEPGGTKIYDELNKTVFANWSQLDPGETIEIKIKYRLPFKLTNKKEQAREDLADQLIYKAAAVLNPEQKNLYSYSLLTQKQPGMNSSLISSELKLSDNFKSIWQYPSALGVSQAGWQATGIFDRDKITAVMIEN